MKKIAIRYLFAVNIFKIYFDNLKSCKSFFLLTCVYYIQDAIPALSGIVVHCDRFRDDYIIAA